jgi:trehalose 6-phosphate synthase
MKKNHGLWIGWAGSDVDIPYRDLLDKFSKDHDYGLKPVLIDRDELQKYYYGFSNETIWPLFHDLLGYCKFEKDNWLTYKEVNSKFADVIAHSLEANDFIWIHDYHLTLVGHYLRQRNIQLGMAYFLHIPFPAYDLFRRLPWREEMIKAMMAYDLLGFQTLRDRRNFVECVKNVLPSVQIQIKRRYSLIYHEGRVIKAGNYPISIDFDEFNELAKTKEVADEAWIFHEKLGSKRLVLGVDRLDYTKGIPERMLAFERALEKYPDLQEKLSLFQLLIPSRTPVPEYKQLKEQLDTLVGRINGRFSTPGWTPIHYMFRTLDRIRLLGVYKACEIALITPLRDGMNLVAKEYCASSIDNEGVLILSEFAGAAEQLKPNALIVNPYNLEETADAINRAFIMPHEERLSRMKKLRSEIKRADVHNWVKWFIESNSNLSGGNV